MQEATGRRVRFPRRIHSAAATLCCAVLSGQAFAQTLVSTDAEYLAALANPGVTHIRLTQGSVLTGLPAPVFGGGYTTVGQLLTLDGEIAGDGSLPVFDAAGGFHPAFWTPGPVGELDSIRNLVFRNSVGQFGVPYFNMSPAIQITGGLRNGMVNVHVQNNQGNARGAVFIGASGGGPGTELRGGIHASSFTGNSAGGSGGGLYVFTLRGGIHNTLFADNRASFSAGGFYVDRFFDGIYNSVFRDNRVGNAFGSGAGFYAENFNGGIYGSEFIGNVSTGSAAGFSARTFTGGIHAHDNGATRFINNRARLDGGGFSAINFSGGIEEAIFDGNQSNSTFPTTNGSPLGIGAGGGGFLIQEDFRDGIHASDFSNNYARLNGGGFLVYRNFFGDVDKQTTFVDNHAELGNGGAFVVNGSLRGNVRDSVFTGNRAGRMGGAVYLGNTIGGVYGSRWIANTAEPVATVTSTSGLGGALYVRDSVTLENNLFLANAARTNAVLDTAGGLGGAVFHDRNSVADAAVTIAARGGNTTLFYGNVHNQGDTDDTYNAVHFGNTAAAGNDRRTNIVIHADTPDDDVLMFDPLSAQADGVVDISGTAFANLETTLTKTGAGNWFLGGVSDMRGDSTWNINDGALHLVTVDYGAGAVDAGIRLSGSVSKFTLDANANLEGSGSIAAREIQLSGYLSPNVQRNDGVKVSEITTATTESDVDVFQDSPYGKLTFDTQGSSNAVEMDGAVFEVDLAYDTVGTPQSDVVHVNGALNVTNTTVDVRSLSFQTPPSDPLETDSALAFYQPAHVITTTGGITGDFKLTVGGAALSAVDYLSGIVGEQVGGDYTVRLGLSWYAPLNTVPGPTPRSGDPVVNPAHGTFTLPGGSTFTLNGALVDRSGTSDSGWSGTELIKAGDGTLILNGVNIYSGDTTVSGGTLVLGDAAHASAGLQSNVTIQSGATLSGYGSTTGAIQVEAGAVLSPGDDDSVGTLSAATLTFSPGGIYRVNAQDDGTADNVKVAGDITLTGGQIDVRASSGAWANDQAYTIIDYGGVRTGAFAGVTTNLAFLTPVVDYDVANQVILRLARNDASFASVCLTFNQCHTAQGVDSLDAAHAVAKAITSMSVDQAQCAYDNLSGEIYGSTRSMILDDPYLRDAMRRRMTGEAQGAAGETLWVNPWGFKGKSDGDGNATDTDHAGMGVALGVDHRFGQTTAGVVFAYEDGKVRNGDVRASRTTVDAYSLGAYAATEIKGIALNGGVAYSVLDMSTRRTLWVPGLEGTARSDYDGHKWQVFAEASKTLAAGAATVTPYARVAQVWLRTQDARESGTAASLTVRGGTDRVFQTTAGVRASFTLPAARPTVVYGDVAWVQSRGDTLGQTGNRFAEAGARFAIRGVEVARNTARIAAGLRTQLSPNAALTLGYQGQLGARTRRHAASLQVRIGF